jgi:kynurenine formamidase
MTFQTDFIATLDHVGTLDAFRHVNPNGKPVDEMPLDLFMGKAVYFEPTSRPRSRRITVPHMEEGEKKAGVNVNGHIVPLCTGFHKRTYPRLDSVWKDKKLPAGRP